MKAMILAAGRGERLRPRTDVTPKPLVQVGGRMLIEWHLEKLARIGVHDVVVNTAWLAEQFPTALGDGSRWGLRIVYAWEGAEALETGGALLAARDLLGRAPFLLVNGDVWTDFDFSLLPHEPAGLAHLVMVDRAAHTARGDFSLGEDGTLADGGEHALTYAGIGVYRIDLLHDWQAHVGESAGTKRVPPRFALAPLLRAHMHTGAIRGQHHAGRWTDVGSEQRLQGLERALQAGPG